ncbi:IS110 family transposase [Microvirga sp. G4-2]|uniref:IS110 family transposase n=1 Tax=Microvirga sp. G4-2 TaxID=3434467 RepID=UPI004043F841
MVHLHAAIGEHAFEIAITDRELQVPADSPKDDLSRELPTLERVLLACRHHEPLSTPSFHSLGGRKLQSCNRTNKTDRNDARGIAQMMRVNLFRPVHVKTLTSQNRRALLTARKLLQEKAIAIENDIRGLLRNFGLKVGIIGKVKFEDRIRELVADLPELADIMACLLEARQSLRERLATLHRKVLATAREDDVCRRLMTIPGVGPVVSLAFSATIDIPARFKNSKAVGPALGLTPVLNQSGESNRIGRVSLCGDAMMRALLYEAAQVLLTRVQKWSWLKAWAMTVARRRGVQKAIVALARRLAVIMHRLWSDGTEFRWTRESAAATA